MRTAPADVGKIVADLASAYGGASQFGTREVARAIAGHFRNQGLADVITRRQASHEAALALEERGWENENLEGEILALLVGETHTEEYVAGALAAYFTLPAKTGSIPSEVLADLSYGESYDDGWKAVMAWASTPAATAYRA